MSLRFRMIAVLVAALVVPFAAGTAIAGGTAGAGAAGGERSAAGGTAVAAACAGLPASLPDAGSLPQIAALPDPFTFYGGTRMSSPADWACRRAQLSELAQYYEYGHLPPPPTSVTGTRTGNTLTVTVTANGRTASFNASVKLPSGSGPFPALIELNPLAAAATSRGYAEVGINPPDIAADSTSKTGAFWTLYPNSDAGVLMAWAWGAYRTLDALAAVPQIDTTKVGVSGYSRYGKAATVAGAFDERIALTVPGSSGTAGMGNFRFFFTNGTNDETLNDILGAAYWFTPRFATFRDQATRLPFDQHEVAALVAPRLLLDTNGTEGSDIRTNPQGTGITYRAAKMVYQFLGVPDRIGINYRPGGHQLDINDYNAIMDFSDKYLKGLPVSRTFDNVPYPAPTTAQIPWTIPAGTPPSSAPPSSAPPSSAPPSSGPPPAGACTASYTVVNQWAGGFQGQVTVRAGAAPISGWTIRWTFPGGQTITQLWNGTYTAQAATVAVRSLSYNGSLPAGGTTTFGFLGTWTAANPAPGDVTCTSP
jgi:hypothetical protein